VAVVSAAVALLCGLGLVAAPVVQSDVEVTWPKATGPVESTVLLLANQTPHCLEVWFSTVAARDASARGGVVLATVRPDRPSAVAAGMVVGS